MGLTAVMPGQAQAFGGGSPITDLIYPLGTELRGCVVSVIYDVNQDRERTAVIYVNGTYEETAAPGGSFWAFGRAVSNQSITAEFFETNCSMTDVDIVSQNGADNGSFEADDYLGIVFEGKVGGQETYRYEIAWQGATDTVLVNTSQQVTFISYRDADGDGHGDAANVTYAETPPSGYVAVAGDCDDANASINPDAPEINDGIDNDCDTEIDEGFDNVAPTVMSIIRQSPTTEATNADALTWRVTFSEAVMNVDVTDFVITGSSTATVTGLSGSGATYDVTASGGNLASANGSVGLGFAGGQNITDTSINALSNTAPLMPTTLTSSTIWQIVCKSRPLRILSTGPLKLK